MAKPLHPLSNQLTYHQVQRVIHRFYERLLAHSQLGPYFSHIKDFSSHEKRIADFWWLVLGGQLQQPPKIDMINKHMALNINNDDLQTWLSILSTTLDQQLTSDQAEQWKNKAHQIGERLRIIVIERQAAGIQITQPKPPTQQ